MAARRMAVGRATAGTQSSRWDVCSIASKRLDGLLQSGPPHALLGVPSLHAGRIQGGTELSVYPARAVLEMERRTMPGEPIDVAVSELQSIAADLAVDDPEFKADIRLLLARSAYETPSDAPVIGRLASAVRARIGEPRIEGVSFWTDAAILGAAGTPTALFGPRGAGLHSNEEHVVIDDLSACADVLRHGWRVDKAWPFVLRPARPSVHTKAGCGRVYRAGPGQAPPAVVCCPQRVSRDA